MAQLVSIYPIKLSRDGALLMSALRSLVPETIQLPVKTNRSYAWTCYKHYVPMAFVPVPNKGFHGLFIETNVVEKGRWKRESYARMLREKGYAYLPPMPWHLALKKVEEYLEGTERWDYELEKQTAIGHKNSRRGESGETPGSGDDGASE